jgi:hypothetical protein
MAWLPFTYRDFHDLPRAIIVAYRGHTYFLDCPFDTAMDDYPKTYAVYRLPPTVGVSLDRSWEGLADLGEPVGMLAVGDMRFDPSLREMLDAAPIAGLLSQTEQ